MATFKIVSEIGVSPHINELIHAYGFAQSIERLAGSNYSNKISLYSDHRVGPYGIRPLRKRYKENKNKDITKSSEKIKFEKLSDAIIKIEKQIFDKCIIKPSDINDESIKPYLIKVKEINI